MYRIKVAGQHENVERFLSEAITLQGNESAKHLKLTGYKICRECKSDSILMIRDSGQIRIMELSERTTHEAVNESVKMGIDSRYQITLKQLKKIAVTYDVDIIVYIAGQGICVK